MSSARTKVLVAMSGGVDSSVAAALLLRRGFDVVGCFMRLGSPGETLDALQPFDSAGVACDPGKVKIGHQGCCSVSDAADARLVAAELGIPFYVCNFKKDFGRIIDYFVDEYASGRTPNPCVRCNDWLKFGKLREYARQIDAAFIASGHYARVGMRPGDAGEEPALLRGLDPRKDQSYVLFGVPREHLAHMLLPIGEMDKARTRDLAQQFGLPVFNKPDSQEICFVPDNDYAGLVERQRPGAAASGDVLDTEGRVLGQHGGQHKFTVGQRRGVPVALGYPLYVVNKDAASNTITLGPREALAVGACEAAEANWLVGPSWWRGADERAVLARYRSTGALVPAAVRRLEEASPEAAATPSGRRGRFEVRFAEPQHAVPPGQAVVLFDADDPERLVGGGWIDRVRGV